jgi:DNA-binding CsgD family transcriptional regulator
MEVTDPAPEIDVPARWSEELLMGWRSEVHQSGAPKRKPAANVSPEIVESVMPRGGSESLRDAAIAFERRERGACRDPVEVSLWLGLVTGKWSIVDQFDTDGRRYLVVRRRDPAASPLDRALTLRERQVASFAGQGHSSKLIAYELGLAESTIAAHLKCAAKKLGCRSRVDLARVVAALRPPS